VLDGEAGVMSLNRENRIPAAMAAIIGYAIVVLTVAGCGSAASTAKAASGQTSPPIVTASPAAPTTSQTLGDDIPPGRGIAEGGGGPQSYTFREEWRKARAEGLKWRGGAYLITATGNYVNDDGVPSSWALKFVDRTAADAVLLVDIDAWGKVTQTREVSGSGVASFVGQYTKRIPYAIIDSDEAVGIGKAALATQFPLDKTTDPSLALNFSALDGSGPYWTYMRFYTSTAEYVSARIDALTGALIPTD
jgi:hypothetical protein